jgi:uncharacterized protein (TIGR02246 family)
MIRATLREVLAKIPGPGGERYADAFRRGTLWTLVYAPRGTDPQQPHEQDELYVVMKGSGTYVVDGEKQPFGEGDVLFAPGRVAHHFENFTDDLVLWVVFYGPPGGEGEGDPRADIERANADLGAALAAGNAAGVAALYTDGARLLPPNHAPVDGRDAIEKFWQGVIDSGVKALTLKTAEVESFGETAVESGSATLYSPVGTVLEHGKYLVVWKRIGGRWRLHRDCWNSNDPAPQ